MVSPDEESRNVLEAALEAHDVGISTVRIIPDGLKAPRGKWKVYQERLPSLEELRAWFATGEDGVALIGGKVSGNLEILDFDQRDVWEAYVEAARATGLNNLIDRIAAGYHEETPNGAHIPYRCTTIEGNQKLANRYLRDDSGTILLTDKGKPKQKAIIETRGQGGYCIAAPSNGKVHESGKPYVLVSGGFATIATITAEERDLLFELARSFDECRAEKEEDPPHGPREPYTGALRPGDDFNLRASWDEVLEHHGWRHVYERGGETYWRRPGKEQGISATTNYRGSNLFYCFSTSTEFVSERGYSKFSAYTLLNHHNDFSQAAAALALDGYGACQTTEEPQAQDFEGLKEEPDGHPPADFHPCTDLGNGERLIDKYGENLRYCNPWKKWLAWSKTRWELDNTQKVRRWAKATTRAIYDESKRVTDQTEKAEPGEKKEELAKRAKALLTHAVKSEATARVDAMMKEAQKDCPVLPERLDANPWLLNVANGTLDLQTGQLRSHAREDLLTKMIPTAHDPKARCPLWEKFLSQIMGGNEELIDFLWKAIGYSLTGDKREDCIFFMYGTGANGKGTFQNTLRILWADYGKQAEFSTFLHKERDSVRNDVADLAGVRMVTAGEPDRNKRLSESLIKQLTGWDPVKARFLFQELFEFVPQMKAWLAFNHKPVITGTDYGIWRRIRLIPFLKKFEGAEKDEHLREKLLLELPGILAWAVRGCLAWQREGLPLPEAVQAATADYRKEMDQIGNFLEESCAQKPHLRIKASDLYTAYVLWSGDKLTTQNAFGRELTDRGFTRYRKQWINGIGLVSQTLNEEEM